MKLITFRMRTAHYDWMDLASTIRQKVGPRMRCNTRQLAGGELYNSIAFPVEDADLYGVILEILSHCASTKPTSFELIVKDDGEPQRRRRRIRDQQDVAPTSIGPNGSP